MNAAAVLSFVLLAIAACHSQCYVVVNTTGKSFLGFTLEVDATRYRNYSLDASIIMTYVKQKKPTLADSVYANGRYAKRASGALVNLKSLGNGVRVNETYYEKFSRFYKTPGQTPVSYIEKYMGTNITAASSPEKVAIGMQWILAAFTAHELDVAYRVVGTVNGSRLANIETQDGFALWLGYDGVGVGLYKHWRDVQTWRPCAGAIVPSTVTSFNKMKTAAKANAAASFRAEYNNFWSKLVPMVYLRSIVYASGLVKRNAAWQRNASGYLKMIQPLLKDATNAASLQATLSANALANPATVKARVAAIAGKQGISSKAAGLC